MLAWRDRKALELEMAPAAVLPDHVAKKVRLRAHAANEREGIHGWMICVFSGIERTNEYRSDRTNQRVNERKTTADPPRACV